MADVVDTLCDPDEEEATVAPGVIVFWAFPEAPGFKMRDVLGMGKLIIVGRAPVPTGVITSS